VWFGEGADEPAFCAAYCRLIEEKAQVGGQAESSGVGYSLAVDEEDVRFEGQFFDGGYADGCLTEREQARDVGESDFSDGVSGFYELQVGQFQDNSRGDNPGFIFTEGAIEARDELRGVF